MSEYEFYCDLVPQHKLFRLKVSITGGVYAESEGQAATIVTAQLNKEFCKKHVIDRLLISKIETK